MAILYRAEVRPSKLELLGDWLPGRPWSAGGTEITQVGSFRFDDPAGEVGIETLLVRAGADAVLQVPLTYRAAPAAGQEDHLIGTLDHSVLGQRWVYDACGDPVYASALAAVLCGGSQADEFLEVDGRLEPREPTARVVASGPPADARAGTSSASGPSTNGVRIVGEDERSTVIQTGLLTLLVVRALDLRAGAPGTDRTETRTLTGTWRGQADPVVLAQIAAG